MHHLQQRLARGHGLPLDLKYMRPTFSAVVDALGGHEGLLWLYVLLKLPSARKLWLATWKITVFLGFSSCAFFRNEEIHCGPQTETPHSGKCEGFACAQSRN